MATLRPPLDDVLCIVFGPDVFTPQRGLTGVFQTMAFITGSPPVNDYPPETWQQCAEAIFTLAPRLRNASRPPANADIRQLGNWLRGQEAIFGTRVVVKPLVEMTESAAATTVSI